MDMLSRKTAVVTGAASGIGKAIAAAFVEAGARVLLCDINREAVDAAAKKFGDCAIGRVTDVSDEDQVEAAMHAARDAFGSLDIVVNCAGFGAITPLIELTGEQVAGCPGSHAEWSLLWSEAWRAPDARTGSSRRHHQHLVSQRTPTGRRTVGLLRGQGGRRHADSLRRAGARRPRDPCGRYCAGPGGNTADASRVGGSLDARVVSRCDSDEARGRSARDRRGRRVPRLGLWWRINGETIAIDGGSLTKGYPALLTGMKKAS